MDETLQEIQSFILKHRKALHIEIDLDPAPHGVRYYVRNYNMDCIPLEGWQWSDPNITNGQVTLALAWQVFLEELKRGN